MSWFLFILLAVLTLGGGLGVVLTRNVVHAALALLLSLVAVAGVYLVLYAEFLALVQVLIYGGAIIIVLLFAIMLTRGSEYPRISDNRQWPLAALAALAAGISRGREPRVTGEALLGSLREAFLIAMGVPPTQLAAADRERAERFAEMVTPAVTTRALEVLGTALIDMRRSPDPRVDLEVALVRLTASEVAGAGDPAGSPPGATRYSANSPPTDSCRRSTSSSAGRGVTRPGTGCCALG